MSSIIQLKELVIPEVLNNISDRTTFLNMLLRKLQEEEHLNVLGIKSDILDNPILVEVRPQFNEPQVI